MKHKIKRMRKLVAIAAADERRVSISMADALSRREQAAQRFAELERYRQDYASAGPQGQVNTFRLLDFQHFLERLDHAIKGQQQVLAELDGELESRRRRWLAKRQRLKSLESALGRFCDDERRADDRLDQKRQDELSSRAKIATSHNR